MNRLCTDVGWRSLNKFGEELCGDHVEIVEGAENTTVVLADGLGSGVKASILSTLTSRIISTMIASSMSLETCVSTIAETLPVCSLRNVAYSTFTIIRVNCVEAELIQYDNPQVILLRDGRSVDYPTETLNIEGKTILRSRIPIFKGDTFVAMSDGVPHAGVGRTMNFGWQRKEIIDFLETYAPVGFPAKTLTTLLLEECDRLYGGEPGDDTTVCTVRLRGREPMNLLIGPPSNYEDRGSMFSQFFQTEGKHIVCGGSTSTIAAEFLGQPLIPSLDYPDPDIPPIAKIPGVDLVTEGVITINRVLAYAQNYLESNDSYSQWSARRDGASRIARMLFEDATDITFFVGRAVNPAHQNPDLPINFNIKMRLIDQLADCLKRMGKRIQVHYF